MSDRDRFELGVDVGLHSADTLDTGTFSTFAFVCASTSTPMDAHDCGSVILNDRLAWVGDAVGDRVGVFVGAAVGAAVGTAVGTAAGTAAAGKVDSMAVGDLGQSWGRG